VANGTSIYYYYTTLISFARACERKKSLIRSFHAGWIFLFFWTYEMAAVVAVIIATQRPETILSAHK